jgi:hypothetical protein
MGELVEGYLRADDMEQLYEAAHMGALVFPGKVDIHVDVCNRVLAAVPTVPHRNGIPEVLDADLVDGYVAVVPLALNVYHHLSMCRETPVKGGIAAPAALL